ncbi:MAG: hypothetical protein ACOYBU_08225 [Dermatophilaceae bacterium]
MAGQPARALMDRQLAQAGWAAKTASSSPVRCQVVVCREVVMRAGHDRADHLLYLDHKGVGVQNRTGVHESRKRQRERLDVATNRPHDRTQIRRLAELDDRGARGNSGR